jgi:hypothetical protein
MGERGAGEPGAHARSGAAWVVRGRGLVQRGKRGARRSLSRGRMRVRTGAPASASERVAALRGLVRARPPCWAHARAGHPVGLTRAGHLAPGSGAVWLPTWFRSRLAANPALLRRAGLRPASGGGPHARACCRAAPCALDPEPPLCRAARRRTPRSRRRPSRPCLLPRSTSCPCWRTSWSVTTAPHARPAYELLCCLHPPCHPAYERRCRQPSSHPGPKPASAVPLRARDVLLGPGSQLPCHTAAPGSC